jgi:hypothetical protein
VFSLDKLAFTGENGAKMSRALLVPTPVEVAGTTEWDLIVPCVYAADIHRVDFEAIIEGALYAAGLAGCNRVGFPAGMALEGVIGKEIIIEIKDRLGTAIRREKIIPRKIEQESCTIIAVRGPNRYKYWDNAGGMIDYEKASKVNIEGVSVKAVKLPTTALFVGFERIPIDE